MKALPFTYVVKGRYWYFRHRKVGQVRLEGQPGEHLFMWRYRQLLAQSGATAKRDRMRRRLRSAERQQARRNESLVYFIGVEPDGPVKIGHARNVTERLATLQVAVPSILKLLGTVPGGQSKEREYHERFAAFRLRGEWFDRSADLVSEIENITGRKGLIC